MTVIVEHNEAGRDVHLLEVGVELQTLRVRNTVITLPCNDETGGRKGLDGFVGREPVVEIGGPGSSAKIEFGEP